MVKKKGGKKGKAPTEGEAGPSSAPAAAQPAPQPAAQAQPVPAQPVVQPQPVGRPQSAVKQQPAAQPQGQGAGSFPPLGSGSSRGWRPGPAGEGPVVAEYAGPPARQASPQGMQGPPQKMQGPPQKMRGPQKMHGPQQIQGPPQRIQGPPQQMQEHPQQMHGPPQQMQGHPQQMQGPPHQMQGHPQQMQGHPQQMQGHPQKIQGHPQQMQGSQQIQGPPQQMQYPPQIQPQHQQQPQPQQKLQHQQTQHQQQLPPRQTQLQQQLPPTVQLQQLQQPQSFPPSEPMLAPSTPTLISVNKGLADMSVVEKKSTPVTAIGLKIPRRRSANSCGTLGRKIIIDTNHLALNLSKLTKEVLHFDVNIDPDRPKRLIRPLMLEVGKQFYPKRCPAFDGKRNLYSSSPLPFGNSMSAEIVVWDEERDREMEFKVAIKYVAKINMEALINNKMSTVSLQSVQALDIILRSAPANRFVSVGRSFFTPPMGRAVDLGEGMEMWLGFFQSAIMGWKPFVNIDVAHKGFPKVQSCEQTIIDLFGSKNRNFNVHSELTAYQVDDFLRYIRELKVCYEIPGQSNSKRTYRVNGVGVCARKLNFKLDDGTNTTVEQYYARTKKYVIKFPFLPCLDVGSPKREKKILVPCELCTLVGGQVVIKKMSEMQTSNLIKQAATSTEERRQKIMDAMRKVDFNTDPSVREFGLHVNDKFEQVPARVLEPPKLKYKELEPVTPSRGVWRNKAFLEGRALDRWTVLSMAPYTREENIRGFVQSVMQQAKMMGMSVSPPQEPLNTKILPQKHGELCDFMKRARDAKLQLVFVVVQDTGNSYSKVKQMSELTVGVLTQCLKNRTLDRMNPATCANILLKVNAKLNGLNHQFDIGSKPPCLNQPCMMVGADVTHPPPDQNNVPSVAAVCASFEPKAFKYNIQYRLQPPRMEIIEDLEAIMKIQLLFFLNATKGHKPVRIIFYRDGVSEGQFQEVLNKEFQAIRRACASLESGYEPKITFLVVQKRHHTRFFPTNPKDSEDRNMNVPAGTIVDTIITHPTDLDFYLVSHASIQGVSRPTKYRRLWDDSNMTEDELEKLTYYLCHMFTRCTRSVSYPAPTYYAHLAAFRARCYIDSTDRFSMNDLAKEQKMRTIQDVIIKDSPMFFV